MQDDPSNSQQTCNCCWTVSKCPFPQAAGDVATGSHSSTVDQCSASPGNTCLPDILHIQYVLQGGKKSSLLPEVFIFSNSFFLFSKSSNCFISLNLKITPSKAHLVTKHIFSYVQLHCVSVSPHQFSTLTVLFSVSNYLQSLILSFTLL